MSTIKVAPPLHPQERTHPLSSGRKVLLRRRVLLESGKEHVEIAAFIGRGARAAAGTRVGLGRLVRRADTGEIEEVEVTVDDAFDEPGLGTLLFSMLVGPGDAFEKERAALLPDRQSSTVRKNGSLSTRLQTRRA